MPSHSASDYATIWFIQIRVHNFLTVLMDTGLHRYVQRGTTTQPTWTWSKRSLRKLEYGQRGSLRVGKHCPPWMYMTAVVCEVCWY